MKSSFLIAVAGLCLLILTNCQKQPNASFVANKVRASVGETIHFDNRTDHGRSYLWDFGDGTTSTEQNPSKVYEKTGYYTVRLTAYSKNKKKQSDDVSFIDITQAPFLGTHLVEGSWYATECKNGYTDYKSGSSNYNLVIRNGSAENEIIIDNFANLGINGVICKVTSFSFFGLDQAEFSIRQGQTLTDKFGRTWFYDPDEVVGEYDNMSTCRTFDIDLSRTALCSGSSITLTYGESLNSCY